MDATAPTVAIPTASLLLPVTAARVAKPAVVVAKAFELTVMFGNLRYSYLLTLLTADIIMYKRSHKNNEKSKLPKQQGFVVRNTPK
jgi:hypothetical protein